MRLVLALLVLALAGCMPEKPAEPDAAPPVAVDDDWCIDSPPPQPWPGTGDPAREYPEEFAVCLYEEERTKLVLYLASLRAWSETQYATYGCE